MDYHFVHHDSMRRKIASGLFIEHAEVHGNIYGTSAAAVNEVRGQGLVCVLDIDVQGVQSVAANPAIEALVVAVVPPSIEELEQRLRGRGTETEASVQLRLEAAAAETELCRELADVVIVNTDSWSVGFPALTEALAESYGPALLASVWPAPR